MGVEKTLFDSEFDDGFDESDAVKDELKSKIGQYSVALSATTPAQQQYMSQLLAVPVEGPVPEILVQKAFTWGKFLGIEESKNATKELSWDAFSLCFSRYRQYPDVWKDITSCLAVAGMLNKIISEWRQGKTSNMYGYDMELVEWLQFAVLKTVELLPDYDPSRGSFPNYFNMNLGTVIEREFYETHIGKSAKYDYEQGFRGVKSVEEFRSEEEGHDDSWNKLPNTFTRSVEGERLAVYGEERTDILAKFVYLFVNDGTKFDVYLKLYGNMIRPMLEYSDRAKEFAANVLNMAIGIDGEMESCLIGETGEYYDE